ncbi:MAG: hypothetical protein ACJLS3_08070 [Erythrobacter sp.]
MLLNTNSWIAAPIMLMLTGCAGSSAPAAPLLGAYFPAWLIAALIGVVAAILARVVLALTGWDAIVPWMLVVCASIGLIVAIAVSALLFG